MKPLTKSLNKLAVLKAKATIEAAGGRIENFTIYYGGDDKATLEAIIFLVDRWDYDFKTVYSPSVFAIFWRAPLYELIFVCMAICSLFYLLCLLIF